MKHSCYTCGRGIPAHVPGRIDHPYLSGPCVTCGELSPKRTRGECPRCATYRHNHGVARPAAVDLMGTLRACRYPGCPTVTRRLTRGYCHRHYMALYRQEHGITRRPYQERGPRTPRCRCARCPRFLPPGHPDFQTLCRACSAEWAREVRSA